MLSRSFGKQLSEIMSNGCVRSNCDLMKRSHLSHSSYFRIFLSFTTDISPISVQNISHRINQRLIQCFPDSGETIYPLLAFLLRFEFSRQFSNLLSHSNIHFEHISNGNSRIFTTSEPIGLCTVSV